MHWKRILAIITPLILIVSACAPKVQVPGSVTDDLGRIVNIESIPQRIISLAPSNTEILFALGLGDKVVGVTNYCDYPQGVNDRCDLPEGSEGKITRVGAPFPEFSIETIASLEPDLVLGFGYTLPGYVTQLDDLGITVIILNPEDIQAILASIELVGRTTGTEAKAKQLTAEMRNDLLSITSETALLSRPTVFYETGYNGGIWTTGAGSFVSSLINLAGGSDIGVAVPSGNPNISLEYITSADPEIIILGDYPWVTPEAVKNRGGAWQNLSAVTQDKIYTINADLSSRPGPRIVQGLQALVEIIHPELEL